MLWIKAFHIIFVVTWFAGLFYLPRFFVYHSMTDDERLHRQFRVMERKLLGITHIGGALALLFGLWLLFAMSRGNPSYWSQGWLHAKLALASLLLFYHIWCARLVGQFAIGANRHSHTWYRWFNELPAVVLVLVVILVVVRPF